MKVFFRKIKNRFKKNSILPSEEDRLIVDLNASGDRISVEKVLNSRCSSDYDDDPYLFHWGMYDKAKTLSSDQIARIMSFFRICRFSDYRLITRAEKNMVWFLQDNEVTGVNREYLMIENGMLQQAASLVNAAFGIGSVLKNLGKDGKELSNSEFATIRLHIDAMKPSYGDSYWTSEPPKSECPWLTGNLPDPQRDGRVPFISALENLKCKIADTKAASNNDIYQLMWAAKGRTPHLCKSKPWGLTIPFWTDKIEITSIYLVMQNKLYKYINWHKGRPTHSINEIKSIKETVSVSSISNRISTLNNAIVIGLHDEYNRAFWEAGYVLFNLLIQAYALDINYHSILLNVEEKKQLQPYPIGNPVALLAI